MCILPYSLQQHEHSLNTSGVVLPGDYRTVAGHDQDCLPSGVVYPPRASSGPQCENRLMPCPAGATIGVPKVSTNRGFMRTVTSFTEGTAFTTLNSSIPDVERFSLAIHRQSGLCNSREHKCDYVVIFPVSSPHLLRYSKGGDIRQKYKMAKIWVKFWSRSFSVYFVRKSALRTRRRPLSWPPSVCGSVHSAARMRSSGLTVFTPITSR